MHLLKAASVFHLRGGIDYSKLSIELTHLSAEYRQGKDAPSDKTASTLDTWNLSGIDSGGAEYELGVDEDDRDRLEKIGTIYSESWDVYRMEFDDDADRSVDEDDNKPV